MIYNQPLLYKEEYSTKEHPQLEQEYLREEAYFFNSGQSTTYTTGDSRSNQIRLDISSFQEAGSQKA